MVKKFHPKEVSFTHPQENFAEQYGFDKKTRLTPREECIGRSKWDKKYEHDYPESCMSNTRPQEHNYMRGKPHGYGCHAAAGAKAGKLRTSGRSGAHRIGKR